MSHGRGLLSWLLLSGLALAACSEPEPPPSTTTTSSSTTTSGAGGACPNGDCNDLCAGDDALLPGAAWPMAGRCPGHAGQSPYSGPSAPTVRWALPGFYQSPTIGDDGTIYLANLGLTALDPSNGKPRWAVAPDPGVPACGTPVLGRDGTIYIGSDEGRFIAVTRDGKKKWSVQLPYPPCSAALLDSDENLYIGTSDMGNGRLYSLDSMGNQRWERALGGDVVAWPALGRDGSIYAAIDAAGPTGVTLFALDPATGATKWSFAAEPGAPHATAPVVADDGTLFFGDDLASGAANFHALTPDGSEKWSLVAAGGVRAPAAVANDGTIYVGSASGAFYALTPDGASKWQFTAPSAIVSPPAIGADGTVHFGALAGTLHAIGADGALKWQLDPYKGELGMVQAGDMAPAIAADGTLYAGLNGYDGMMIAVGP